MCGSVSTVERPPAKGQIWGNTLKLLTSTSIFLVRCVALFSSPDMENNITLELSTMSKKNHRSEPTWWNKWYKKNNNEFYFRCVRRTPSSNRSIRQKVKLELFDLWQGLLEQRQWEETCWNVALWDAFSWVWPVWKDTEEQELLFKSHDTNTRA